MENIISQVNEEAIYKVIRDLEGPKHPIDNMDALNKAADYISDYLKSIGCHVEEQVFNIKGFDQVFRNIIGRIGDPKKPAILLGSHYDTVRFSPGANDNLSGLAVSLEVARLLMMLENPPSVIIAAFTLEEGHPGPLKTKFELMEKEALVDKDLKYTSAKLLAASKTISKTYRRLKKEGLKVKEIYQLISKESLNPEERQIVSVLNQVYDLYDEDLLQESISLVGSSEFIKKVKEENIAIKSILNYDCLGWIKSEAGTQKALPVKNEYLSFFDEYEMSVNDLKGNYIGIAGDKNSNKHVEKFSKACKAFNCQVPHLAMKLPLGHEDLKKMLPDILRSDHSPFWKENIPGLFISDFANFRSELYHTPGDASEHIDYQMLKKVTQASLRYLLD